MTYRMLPLAMSLILTLTLATGSSAQASHTASKADFERWMKQLSNWGRWGKDDQKGTVNLITAAKVKHAATLAKSGITVSLERRLNTEKSADNANPLTHTMTNTGENPVAGAYAMDSY